ncbi:MAG: AAA family ATPase [Gemmatimonadales bacterium]|nr:AAA family ATPase [Gemmatimonadales bacterium]NIN10174.1 AAA family ATPase [Gemmatimonadales bacterium]NIN50762.1 AAA family ATPase [Gemmatimonadales bacterium]NIP08226.1 AAA family ATPase [Gemmatimonadales bacterium]NIQ99390.1 AAA family ATPase [Gemmatimonadales bacterium]
MEVVSRFLRVPDQSFFLLGPRGTGKTTWLAHRFPEALVFDLLRPDVYRELGAHPERLAHAVLGSPGRSVVVIDEVQRVPELLNVVHDLIERKLERRFVLTGSSARKLRRGGVDLLAGRAAVRTMHPFMAAELPGFDLAAAVQHGLLPLVVAASDPEDVLRAYASLYLEQEVQLEGWVRNIGSFGRFLEAVSFSHAGVLNVSAVARECQAERKTVAGYLEVLEDLLLSYRLPVFTRRARRETVAHPKFYLFDAGVYRSLRPRGPLDRPEEIEGAALEGLVAQHLRAWIAYSGGDAELFYWRTRSGVEVDFVVYGAAGFWAIEVKNSARVRREQLRALRAFKADHPECEALLLYRGEDPLRIGEIQCCPVEAFLRELRPSQGLAGAG